MLRKKIIVKALALLLAISVLCLGAAFSSAPPVKPYTIAWLSDTQYYSASYPQTFFTMTKYLADEADSLNLGYVAHTGDIVNRAENVRHWESAKEAMNNLYSIPHGVLAGNHDRNKKIGYANFSKYFGESFYAHRPYYGDSYEDNRAHYDLITLGKTDYLFVYIGYPVNYSIAAWANGVFRDYPERVGILLVHDYLDGNSDLLETGIMLQKEVVATNPNLYMVLCGHHYTQDCVPAQFDDNNDGSPDRTVYQCIANYQNLENGGLGYIRFIEIHEAAGMMRFYTYSPLLDEYRAPPDSATSVREYWPLPWLNR